MEWISVSTRGGFVSLRLIHEWPQKGWQTFGRLEGREFASCDGIQHVETPRTALKICLIT